MSETKVGAFTAPEGSYPPYINVTMEGGKVRVTVRSPPVESEGVNICGFAGRDDHQPGRCTPTNGRCNNYCNAKPGEPMPDSPLPCTTITQGATASIELELSQWEAVIEALG